MHRDDGRRVLYLRGYDFEAAFATGGDVAAGIATWDTTAFTLKLPQLLGAGHGLVKVLSPKEVDRETVTIERWYDDFDAMIQWINRRPLAFYLNALHWKKGVLDLIPRMDHYVVYVSSLTESALWELDQLDTDARRHRVTVVLDEDAIAQKTSQLALQEGLGGRLGEAIWTAQGRPSQLTAPQVRKSLAEKFFGSEFRVRMRCSRTRLRFAGQYSVRRDRGEEYACRQGPSSEPARRGRQVPFCGAVVYQHRRGADP
jgi:hypothetical protein